MRHRYFAAVMLLGLLLAVHLVSAQGAVWTVMVYMEADNNLEGDALADILEMEMIGSSDAVNVIVQIDRAEDYAAGDGDWTDARRYYIEKNDSLSSVGDLVIQKVNDPDSITIGSPVVEELGEINNGDPQTLIDFILWSAQNYPAEKYALVLWNHGGTWVGGFGGDESTEDHDGINIPELDAALSLATEAMGQKFEFIGFDTCLMGQTEVFMVLAQYANYAAGAEELEPGFGWFYTPVVETLTSNPGISGNELAQSVVSAYMGFYDELMPALAGEPFWMNYDQTAVDLSKMAGVEAAISNFSQIARENAQEILPAVSDARNNAQVFGGATPDETDPLSSVDLVHFMEILIRLSENAAVDQAAQEVIAAVDELVLVSAANDGLPGARGLSIFFPRNSRIYALDNNQARYSGEIAYMADWQMFLDTFYGTARETATAGSVAILEVFTARETASFLNPPTVLFETNGQNITSVSFSAVLQLDDGSQVMLDQSALESLTYTEAGEPLVDFADGVSESQFTWGAEMPIVTDGAVTVPTLLLDIDNPNLAAVSGLYGFQNGETIDAFLLFHLETRELEVVWGVNQSENGGQPFEITTSPGDQFLPTWRFIGENGETTLIPADQVLTFGDEPFRFDFVPAVSGTYQLYIVMEDVAGNIYIDSAELLIDNDNLVPDYRGTNDLNEGISYVYPWGWSEPIDIELEEGGVQTLASSPGGTLNVYFNYYDADSLDVMLDTAYAYADNIGITLTTDPEAVVLGGYDGYIMEYELTTNEGAFYSGALLLTYVADNARGYLIDFEAGEDASGDDLAYLNVLIESVQFFTPLDMLQ